MTESKKTGFNHILITGASSGIGEALALGYAARGVTLSLSARNQERLNAVAEECCGRGADVITGIIDVTDRAGMADWIKGRDSAAPIDLVIANAGISAGTSGVIQGEDPAQVRHLFDVNLTGALNTIEPVLPLMIRRGEGHVALMSSLAGFRGWTGAPAYCASKAAVKVYGEGLRGSLVKTGVNISVICPGFVASRMTDANDFHMPFLLQTDCAAKIIMRGLAKNRGRIAFPFPAYVAAWFVGLLPDSWAQTILKKTPAKESSARNR